MEDIIHDFQKKARMFVDRHTNMLKEKYSNKDFTVQSSLQEFNTHLQQLKSELNLEIKKIIMKIDNEKRNAVTVSLHSIYHDCIHDFFKKDFR
jgi:hypothetical protein